MTLLTVTEACEFLNVSRRTMGRLRAKRRFPEFRIEGSVRIAREDLEQYLRAARRE